MNKLLFYLLVIVIIAMRCTSGNPVETTKINDSNNNLRSPNPSACYCDQMGYQYTIEKVKNGEDGFTILPNGVKVNAWTFFRGEVYPEYSYCARRGYQTVTDTINHGSYTTVCAACVEYDNQHNIIMKMPMREFMELYGDTLCNGKPYFRNSSRIK